MDSHTIFHLFFMAAFYFTLYNNTRFLYRYINVKLYNHAIPSEIVPHSLKYSSNVKCNLLEPKIVFCYFSFCGKDIKFMGVLLVLNISFKYIDLLLSNLLFIRVHFYCGPSNVCATNVLVI